MLQFHWLEMVWQPQDRSMVKSGELVPLPAMYQPFLWLARESKEFQCAIPGYHLNRIHDQRSTIKQVQRGCEFECSTWCPDVTMGIPWGDADLAKCLPLVGSLTAVAFLGLIWCWGRLATSLEYDLCLMKACSLVYRIDGTENLSPLALFNSKISTPTALLNS